MDKVAKDPRLKKANAVVHISNKLTLLERKLFNALLFEAYPSLLKGGKHRISRKDLGEAVGFDSNDTELLKQALRKLRETEIEWVTISGTNEDWTTSGFLASGRLTKGVCEFSFSAHLTELLYHPRTFTRFFLEVQRKLGSYQSLALYENVARFRRIKSTGWVEVNTWRKLLGVDGFPSYSNFKTFHARVVKRAVADVNRYSDIHLTAEFKKEGRQIIAMRFKIRENPQPGLFGSPVDEDDEFEERYLRVVERLTGEQTEELKKRFEREIVKDSSFLLPRYKATGFESRAVELAYKEFVLEQSGVK